MNRHFNFHGVFLLVVGILAVMYNPHTGESLNLVYCENGYYVPGALQEVNYFFRDFRQNLVKPIDLDALQRLLASRKKARDEEAARLLSVVVRTDPAAAGQGAAERAEVRLRGNSYLALKNISCKCQNGVLTLNGCLPSYYLKQVAQTAVAGVEGVKRIENRIEVVARG